MKLYCTTFFDDATKEPPWTGGDPIGPCSTWQGTQDEQRKAVKKLKSEGMRNVQTHTVAIATSKNGLLEFLNERGVRP